MEREDRIRAMMGETPDSARRASAPRTQHGTDTSSDSTFKYPPTTDRPLSWNCMVLAGSGFVLKYDPDAAKKLVDAHRSRRRGAGRNTRTARRTTDNPTDDTAPDPAPPQPNNTQRTAAEVVAGANWATSVEKGRHIPATTRTGRPNPPL